MYFHVGHCLGEQDVPFHSRAQVFIYCLPSSMHQNFTQWGINSSSLSGCKCLSRSILPKPTSSAEKSCGRSKSMRLDLRQGLSVTFVGVDLVLWQWLELGKSKPKRYQTHLLSTRLSAGLWMCSSLSTFLQSWCSELNKPSKYSLSREDFKA